MLILLSMVGAAEAGCDQATTLGEFIEISTRGEAAFSDMDPDGLAAARADGLAALECLKDPITTPEAAAFHRLMGMHAFTTELRDMAILEFYAARSLEPGYSLPEDVAPVGHPMIEIYEQSVVIETGELQTPEHNGGGWVAVDGVRGRPRSSEIPAIFQAFDTSGRIEESIYLFPGDALPDAYLPQDDKPVPLAVASGALAVVASGLAVQAWRDKNAFNDDATPTEDLDSLFVRNRALGFSAIGTGTVAAGLGVYTALNW